VGCFAAVSENIDDLFRLDDLAVHIDPVVPACDEYGKPWGNFMKDMHRAFRADESGLIIQSIDRKIEIVKRTQGCSPYFV